MARVVVVVAAAAKAGETAPQSDPITNHIRSNERGGLRKLPANMVGPRRAGVEQLAMGVLPAWNQRYARLILRRQEERPLMVREWTGDATTGELRVAP